MKVNRLIISAILVLINSTFLLSQEKYFVKGVVRDSELNEGLPGATVLIKGTATSGTITDFEGNFKLEVAVGDVLSFSFTGFLTEEVEIIGQSVIDMSLETNIASLEEVVITGYGEIRKSDLTGAVGSLDISDVEALPVSNISEALQGRIAGVSVTQNSGSPGDGTSIRIRGVGTISNDASPLYVVDGIIVDEINYLSQNDIQSLEVMKDASVAALYGARAANGVIVITTKQGKKGKLTASFSSQFGFQNLWRKPDLMDAREYRLMQALSNGGDVRSFEVKLDEINSDMQDNDWIDIISQTGTRQQYSASMSGGSEALTYRFATNFYDEEGIIINSGFRRVNLTSDLTFNATKKLKFRANFLYSNRNRNVQNAQELLRSAINGAPTTANVDIEGVEFNTPLRQAKENVDDRILNNFQVKLYADYKISESLKFQSRFGLDDESVYRDRFEPPANFELSFGTTTARIRNNINKNFKWSWEQVLLFNKSFGDHSLAFTGAFSLERKSLLSYSTDGISPLGRDENTAYLLNTYSNFDLGGTEGAWSQVGSVFRGSYSYKHKYFVQFNVRADGSSRFADGEKWGYSPSASLAWVLSDDLFPGNPIVPLAKLRLSYGVLGNNRIGNYESYTLVNGIEGAAVTGSDTDFNVLTGFASKSIGNTSITWERTFNYNLGLDLELGSNLFLTTEVFRRHTNDILLNVPVVLSSGLSNVPDDYPRRNLGEVINDGLELTLNYINQIGDLDIDLGLNGGYLINRVESLGANNEPVFGGDVNLNDNANLGFITKTVVGRPIGSFYGFVVDGIEDDGAVDGVEDRDGQFIFKDLNNDGVITDADRTFIGNPIPDFTYGFTANFRYKQFDLSAQLQGVYGNEIFNVVRYFTHGLNGGNALSGLTTRVYRNDIDFSESSVDFPNDIIETYTGKNENPELPVLSSQADNDSYSVPSDFYIEDGSYVRLKNLQLGYSFSTNLLSKLHMGSLRVYASGQNLITLTNYEGFDPEISNDDSIASGLDRGTYPQGRLFLIGFNATF